MPLSTPLSTRRILFALLAFSLGGCSTAPWAPIATQAETPPPEVKPKAPRNRPKPTPAPGAAGARATPEAPATPPKTAAVTLTPERLVGRDEAGIRSLFGAPAGHAERPPARIWTYEATGCRLELSFYMDVASQTFRVLTYDVTPKAPAALEGERCLAALGTAKG